MMLLALPSVTGPVLEMRRFGIVSELKVPSLMLPLLISDSVLLPGGLLIAAVMVMLPAIMLPMRSVPAVISLSSAWVRPSTPGASLPPRLMAWLTLAGVRLVAAVPELTPLLMNIASAMSVIDPLLDLIAVAPVLSAVKVWPGPACSVMLPVLALFTICGSPDSLPGEVSIVMSPAAAVIAMLPEVLLIDGGIGVQRDLAAGRQKYTGGGEDRAVCVSVAEIDVLADLHVDGTRVAFDR